MEKTRIAKQLGFIAEIDRLKTVLRRTILMDSSRLENSAEHSWHIAVMAMLLAEHTDFGSFDVSRVVRMLLVHDVVEVDAGDTFCYDTEAADQKRDKELKAAERLFGLLPDDQSQELRELWDEFEARETPEARFANAVDRMQPVLLNLASEGYAWRNHGVAKNQVLERNSIIGDASASLWAYFKQEIEKAAEKGWLVD
jgi:putative hydrolase of HD superfamily